MDAVKRYCNKAILIKDGNIIASGDKDAVADQYTLENIRTDQKHSHPKRMSILRDLMTVFPYSDSFQSHQPLPIVLILSNSTSNMSTTMMMATLQLR